MSRPLRIEFPGAVYHITSRGNRREPIYRDDADRAAFLAVLAQVCERSGWSCHAYCLMTNHYHLVIETAAANLARGMRQLNGVYTQRFNRAHRCVGHVFQGRYSAVLVQREYHLLTVIRYVMLNPVRARLVAVAGGWPWSSYGATVGEVAAPAWLRTDWIAIVLGSSGVQIEAIAQFIDDGLAAPSCWQHLTHQIYLGDAAFVASSQARVQNLSRMTEVARLQRVPVRVPLEGRSGNAAMRDVDRTARNQVMVAAFDTGLYSMREIGDCFGLHYSWVSRVIGNVKRLEAARGKT